MNFTNQQKALISNIIANVFEQRLKELEDERQFYLTLEQKIKASVLHTKINEVKNIRNKLLVEFEKQ